MHSHLKYISYTYIFKKFFTDNTIRKVWNQSLHMMSCFDWKVPVPVRHVHFIQMLFYVRYENKALLVKNVWRVMSALKKLPEFGFSNIGFSTVVVHKYTPPPVTDRFSDFRSTYPSALHHFLLDFITACVVMETGISMCKNIHVSSRKIMLITESER